MYLAAAARIRLSRRHLTCDINLTRSTLPCYRPHASTSRVTNSNQQAFCESQTEVLERWENEKGSRATQISAIVMIAERSWLWHVLRLYPFEYRAAGKQQSRHQWRVGASNTPGSTDPSVTAEFMNYLNFMNELEWTARVHELCGNFREWMWMNWTMNCSWTEFMNFLWTR